MKPDLQTMIDEAMIEVPTNLTWNEKEVWKGWTYNFEKNRYYFDDIGNESIVALWDSEFLGRADD
jgi:hypothetical protein